MIDTGIDLAQFSLRELAGPGPRQRLAEDNTVRQPPLDTTLGQPGLQTLLIDIRSRPTHDHGERTFDPLGVSCGYNRSFSHAGMTHDGVFQIDG